jgi:nucleoid-associated protein YgaU
MFARPFQLLALLALLAVALLISNARPAGGAGPELRYVVKPGDTLWSIAAARYEGDPREGVWRLEHRNRLSEATLTPGTVMYLPP